MKAYPPAKATPVSGWGTADVQLVLQLTFRGKHQHAAFPAFPMPLADSSTHAAKFTAGEFTYWAVSYCVA